LADKAIKNSSKLQSLKLDLEKAEQSFNKNRSFIYPKLDLELRIPININKTEQEVFYSNLDQYQLISRLDKYLNPSASFNLEYLLPNNGLFNFKMTGLNRRRESDLLENQNRLISTATLDYEQRLFSQNIYKVDKLNTDIELKTAQLNYFKQKNEFLLDLIEQYYGLVLELKKIELNKVIIFNNNFHHAQTLKLFETGRKTELDTLNTYIELKNVQLDKIQKSKNVKILKKKLEQFIGFSIADSYKINTQIDYIPFSMNLNKIVELNIFNYPDFQIDSMAIKKSNLSLNKIIDEVNVKYNFYTSLVFDNYQDFIPQSTTAQYYNWSVGLNINIPIYNGGKSSALIEESKIDIKQSQIELNEKRKSIENNIRENYQILLGRKEELEILKTTVSASKKALELAKQKYSNGYLTALELNEIENNLINAELKKLQTIIEYNKTVYQLKIYAGMELLP
jgi:outer membrane protein TolC